MYKLEFQDTKSGETGSSEFDREFLDIALAKAYIEWRRTEFRNVRIIKTDGQLVMQYWPRKGTH